MQPLYDITSVLKTLTHGINRGYWTLDDLDTPPPGHINSGNHKNLLRDYHPEAVQAQPDPRDFVPSQPQPELPTPDDCDF